VWVSLYMSWVGGEQSAGHGCVWGELQELQLYQRRLPCKLAEFIRLCMMSCTVHGHLELSVQHQGVDVTAS